MPESKPNYSYNYIYDKLVKDKNDILGIIAYSIYKRQKIEHLRKFKEENKRDADQNDLNLFKEISNSDTQLEFYNTQAVHLANAFLEEMLHEHIEEKEKELSNRVHAELSGIKNKFWNGVAQSLVGSIVFVLFLGVIVFFSWSLNQGVKNAVESIFNINITDNKSTSKQDLTTSPPQQNNEHPISQHNKVSKQVARMELC